MAKVLVVLGHPSKESFNHAIAETVLATLKDNNHEVIFHDLYAEKFDPVLPEAELLKDAPLAPGIARYCSELRISEGIIIIHPCWWGQPPALLKGWIDRILRTDVAYKFVEADKGMGIPVGLLKARASIVFNTSNTPREKELTLGDPLETLWQNCILGLCGVSNFRRRNFGVMITSTLQQRQKWLDDVREITNEYFPKIAPA